MRKLFSFRHTILSLLLIQFATVYGQLPPNQPEQDCFGALPICNNIYIQTDSYTGAGGNSDEINGANSCMVIGERNSVWYVFTVQSSGSLCFTISPIDTLDDYDWAVYNLTGTNCSAIYSNPALEVSCNWQPNNGCQGVTGANGNTGLGCGFQNEACLLVTAGETYVINVSNFTASNSGYVLDLGNSSAQLFDNIPPEMDHLSAFCPGVAVNFSENVICSSVDSTDFTFSGPGGPYTITNVTGLNCSGGGLFGRTYNLTVDPPVTVAGTYTVSMVGSVFDNCSNASLQSTESFFIIPPPTSAITPVNGQCERGNDFTFTYSGSSAVNTYNWDFGDGAGSVTPIPSHTYGAPGIYIASLEVVDDKGCGDISTTQVEVFAHPEADFVMDSVVCEANPLTLDNETTDGGGPPLSSYFWKFGDEETSTLISPNHIYNRPGPHIISLISTSIMQCKDTAEQLVLVYPIPDVDFLLEDDVCIGDTSHFLYLSSIRNDIAGDVITGWDWAYGDGATAGSIEAPTHLYATAGTYPATLYVHSDKGCTDSLIQDMIIHQPPPPDLTPDTVCIDEPAQLVAVPISGAHTEWFENPGDSIYFHYGLTYLLASLSETDTFYVETISDIGCISERVPITAAVRELEDAHIIASDSLVEIPLSTIDFSVENIQNSYSYLWNFGDGMTSDEMAPQHIYEQDGQFRVWLSLEDLWGCEFRLFTDVEVLKNAGIHVPTAFTPNGDGYNDEFYIGHSSVQDFSIKVYNRFGTLVYQSDDPNFRWSGESLKGNHVREGVYVVQIQATDIVGLEIDELATLTILR